MFLKATLKKFLIIKDDFLMYTIFKTYHSHSLFLGLVKQQILQILIFLLAINHSLLKLLTGFAIAAFIMTVTL
jgi:hypothetical protein